MSALMFGRDAPWTTTQISWKSARLNKLQLIALGRLLLIEIVALGFEKNEFAPTISMSCFKDTFS